MEANRCHAIGRNGRHCNNPLNPVYQDLCTQHGKMEAGGQHLQRFQPDPQEAAARVIQEAAHRHVNNNAREAAARAAIARQQGFEVETFEGLARLIGPQPRPGEPVVVMTEAQFRALVHHDPMPMPAPQVREAPRPQPGPPVRRPNQANMLAPQTAIYVDPHPMQSSEDATRATMAKLLSRINAQKPVTFVDRIGTDCAICQCKVEADQPDFGLPCGHDTHFDCGKELHDNRCPMCRAEFHRLREQNAATDEVVKQIKLRRQAAIIERNDEAARMFADDSDEDDDSNDDETFLPDFGTPEYDDVVGHACHIYSHHPEFAVDPSGFHDHLHHMLGLQRCEDVEVMMRAVFDIFSGHD